MRKVDQNVMKVGTDYGKAQEFVLAPCRYLDLLINVGRKL
jgi:hypothetical protein